MQVNLKAPITALLSVRKGLESCLLNEIKNSNLLSNIQRIKYKSGYTVDLEDKSNATSSKIISKNELLSSCINLVSVHAQKWRLKSQQVVTKDNIKSTENILPVISDTGEPKPALLQEKHKIHLHLQSGGIQVKGNLEWILRATLTLQSIESVWIRVGEVFRCHSNDDLIDRISKLPWNLHLPCFDFKNISLRIISRHSTVWSRVVIADCLKKGLELYVNKGGEFLNVSNLDPKDFCISIVISRNTCHVAVQSSGLLSPRFYNYINYQSGYKPTVPFNHWSLSQIAKQIRAPDKFPLNAPKQLNKTQDEAKSVYETRLEFIQEQVGVTNDKLNIADATIGALLNTRQLRRNLEHDNLLIWNPFCSAGNLLCEIIKQRLRLPNISLEHNDHTTQIIQLLLGCNFQVIEQLLETIQSEYQLSDGHVEIVASDPNIERLNLAKQRLSTIRDTFKKSFQRIHLNPLEFGSLPSVVHILQGNNIGITLHQEHLHNLANHLVGALVISVIPFQDFSSPKARKTAIALYKEFGDVIGSRDDWKGVFVISRGRAFEYYSGLEWKTLIRIQSPQNDVIKLLSTELTDSPPFWKHETVSF
ncbi:hypothetical protein BdWA1_002974 [Babesia duncani]|uniref:Uncharacterized protein n=1 Tax=Babesia duncani TaxID=323732 RepID=A0AAD9PI57_9APIC|nr:hypothetical protein BdWA1_002974 [Babesia duncani]